ncbi:MAG TPA: hypothetical protein VLI68_13805 [Hanamia sp.]|jgi:hypothetical protein|nr:hypothetical protein [Hanamia sp.]
MKRLLLKKFSPVFLLFILLNILVFIFKKSLIDSGFNISFLLSANVILFLLSFFGFFIQTKGISSTNINAFIRGVYSSLLLKLFVIVIAIVIYILVMHGDVNIPSLFTAMAIYIIYTSVEVIQLMKLARKKPDA